MLVGVGHLAQHLPQLLVSDPAAEQVAVAVDDSIYLVCRFIHQFDAQMPDELSALA